MNAISKFQKFKIETIARGQIHGAPYNPRVISEDAKKRLRKMIARHGLIQPLVWNRRTGNLVAGHRRIEILDALERSQNYFLQVASVDLNVREEKILNVQLNNPSMQGDWDMDKLTELASEGDVSPAEMGFSDGDIAVMFGGDERLDELMGDVEGVVEAKNTLREIKEHRAESMAKMQEAQAADFYFTVVCETEAQKKEILKALGVPAWEAFAPGKYLAGALGL